MRQREICKHQVCNHCGGRFGMVTHRWWGNKFCKRRCKNAYLRGNHHTLSGWVASLVTVPTASGRSQAATPSSR
jgi:hypothetical protein